MGFCNNFLSGVRKVMGQVDSTLGKTIEEITKYTKLVKDLGMSPQVQALIALVDKGGKVNGWIETAVDEITSATGSTKTLAEKLNEWLSTATSETDFNKKVFNLASVAAKVADVEAGNEPKAEHVYDTGTLAQILADKK